MSDNIGRREFVRRSALLSGGMMLPNLLSCGRSDDDSHPRIYISQKQNKYTRTVDELRNVITSGHARDMWQNIHKKAVEDIGRDPLFPSTMFPGRNAGAAKHNNPDYTICLAAGRRILQNALAALITGDEAFKRAALDQMSALFDPELWPDWMDQSHIRFGLQADLRTGMLSLDVALAYDWLYHHLSEAERDFIIEGLDRRGIQPYLSSMAQNPWWANDLNNWLTVIIGGLGIAGMALGKSHPDSQRLIDISIPLMNKYMSIYGSEGEFNESVSYANATRLPVAYYYAYQCWSGARKNVLAQAPFPQTCYWKMYMTLPPGRVAAFGDSHLDTAPEVKYIAAVASASQDPVLQGFYLQYAPVNADPIQLLWYDTGLEAESPAQYLPLGKTFHSHGACMSNRSDWNPETAACVIYGKAGREENHEHNDVGQLCVDGYGERLIVDLGSPSGYPADFFEENRWKYYNASISGHNVLMFDGREMRVPDRRRGEKFDPEFEKISGKIVNSFFDDKLGCSWGLDLTGAYEDVKKVTRIVLHYFPGIIAVVDQADLVKEQNISLRWHTFDACEPDDKGQFIVKNGKAILSGRVINIGKGRFEMSRKQHRYSAPFDRDRLGDPLEQRHESYIECSATVGSCRLLTLFSVAENSGKYNNFIGENGEWRISTKDDDIAISIDNNNIVIQGRGSGRKIQAALKL